VKFLVHPPNISKKIELIDNQVFLIIS